jgi:DNA mismatch repair protein MutL
MAPSIDFDVADCPDIPVFSSGNTLPPPPMPTVDTSYNPFKQNGSSDGYKRPTTRWDDLYKGIEGSSVGREIKFDDTLQGDMPWDIASKEISYSKENKQLFAAEGDEAYKCSECYQYKGQYIVTSMKSGLVLIDQHRAHIRILFERYLKQLGEYTAVSQGMLFPEMIELSIAQATAMESLLEDFSHLGFDISNMGGGSFAIQGIPEGIAGLSSTKLVTEMLESAMEKGVMSKEDIHHNMALTMARSAALVVGEVLSPAEMLNLVNELFMSELPSYTPDGRKTFITIDDSEVEKMFR